MDKKRKRQERRKKEITLIEKEREGHQQSYLLYKTYHKHTSSPWLACVGVGMRTCPVYFNSPLYFYSPGLDVINGNWFVGCNYIRTSLREAALELDPPVALPNLCIEVVLLGTFFLACLHVPGGVGVQCFLYTPASTLGLVAMVLGVLHTLP